MVAKYRYQEGLVYKLLGDLKRSARALERSLDLDSSAASAHRVHDAFAEVYQQMGRVDGAAQSHFQLGWA